MDILKLAVILVVVAGFVSCVSHDIAAAYRFAHQPTTIVDEVTQ